jgi:transaldolase
MKKNPLLKLHALGQSIWLHYIRRDLISSGELSRLIAQDGLRGITSNPAIFEHSIIVLNDMDRFHLAKDVIDRVPSLGARATTLTQFIRDKLIDHKQYIRQYGEDMPEIRDWKWGAKEAQQT